MVSYGRSGEKGGVACKDSGKLRAERRGGSYPPVGKVVSNGRSGEKGETARKDSGKLRVEWEKRSEPPVT